MVKPVIVTRAGKGSALSFVEGDANFTNLQNAVISVVADQGTAQSIDLNSQLTISGGVGLTSVTSASTVVVDLDNTAVTAGSYVKASVTVDAQGRVTAATNGAADFTVADARTAISLSNAANQTFVVTVQYDAGTYQNVFYIDGIYKPALTLQRLATYTFVQSDASNSNHPIAFRDITDIAFTQGVTSTGTPGSAGAQTVFVVPSNAPSTLKYYCTVHGNGMGNSISVTAQPVAQAGTITYNNTTGVIAVTNTSLAGLQLTSEKNTNNGYAGLDAGGKVASAQLPSYVDDVEEYSAQANFPATGETSKIYVALDNNKIFRWSGSAYVEISASPGTTDAVPEGTNLYFTTQRARDAFSASTGITITSGAIATTITQYTDAQARNSISASGNISYNNTTGAISTALTQYTDTNARGALSGSTGISYNSSTGAIAIANTAVTPAAYTNASITVDAQGRITAASSGTAGITSGGALGTPSSGNLSNCTADGTNSVGYRSIPSAGAQKTSSYTLTTADRAEFVQTGSGGAITVPNSTFSAGDVVVIYNDHTAAVTITLSTTNAYIAGTNTNKTSVSLATRGVCNILFISSTVAILTGNIT